MFQIIDQFLPLLFQSARLLFGRETPVSIPRFHKPDHPWNAGIGKTIKHMFPAFVAFNDVCFFQHIQMLADG